MTTAPMLPLLKTSPAPLLSPPTSEPPIKILASVPLLEMKPELPAPPVPPSRFLPMNTAPMFPPE